MAKNLNYNLVTAGKENHYSIFETSTEQVLKTFDNFNEARKFMRHLNLGGGFDGWTPSFLLKNVNNLYK
jgi:hypothetical protein